MGFEHFRVVSHRGQEGRFWSLDEVGGLDWGVGGLVLEFGVYPVEVVGEDFLGGGLGPLENIDDKVFIVV